MVSFRENELRRIKNSYRETSVQSELENRMHSLTQSLLTKQNNLENITAERNALKLHLEKLSVSLFTKQAMNNLITFILHF